MIVLAHKLAGRLGGQIRSRQVVGTCIATYAILEDDEEIKAKLRALDG